MNYYHISHFFSVHLQQSPNYPGEFSVTPPSHEPRPLRVLWCCGDGPGRIVRREKNFFLRPTSLCFRHPDSPFGRTDQPTFVPRQRRKHGFTPHASRPSGVKKPHSTGFLKTFPVFEWGLVVFSKFLWRKLLEDIFCKIRRVQQTPRNSERS
jgi:hypothetical protein